MDVQVYLCVCGWACERVSVWQRVLECGCTRVFVVSVVHEANPTVASIHRHRHTVTLVICPSIVLSHTVTVENTRL